MIDFPWPGRSIGGGRHARIEESATREGMRTNGTRRNGGGNGKNRIMIFGTAADEALAISIPRTETAAIRHFQERMPHGLFVPDAP